VNLHRAFEIARWIVEEARGPVSLFIADDHGELVLALAMDDAAPDTRLNAQRKAYTAARSDAASTRELATKVRDDPTELASFDPLFTFFTGGVAAFRQGRRVGAVGVSGLSGDEDEALARGGIEAAGLSTNND
jgi:glc operon protein GlcG